MQAAPRDHRHYRQLAEESRKKAEAASEPLLRQSYLDLAASYDKLADTLERPLDPFIDNQPDPPPR